MVGESNFHVANSFSTPVALAIHSDSDVTGNASLPYAEIVEVVDHMERYGLTVLSLSVAGTPVYEAPESVRTVASRHCEYFRQDHVTLSIAAHTSNTSTVTTAAVVVTSDALNVTISATWTTLGQARVMAKVQLVEYCIVLILFFTALCLLMQVGKLLLSKFSRIRRSLP